MRRIEEYPLELGDIVCMGLCPLRVKGTISQIGVAARDGRLYVRMLVEGDTPEYHIAFTIYNTGHLIMDTESMQYAGSVNLLGFGKHVYYSVISVDGRPYMESPNAQDYVTHNSDESDGIYETSRYYTIDQCLIGDNNAVDIGDGLRLVNVLRTVKRGDHAMAWVLLEYPSDYAWWNREYVYPD